MSRKYIKSKDGKFAGSLPDAKNVPSAIKLPKSAPAAKTARTPQGIEWVVTLKLEDGSTIRGVQTARFGHAAIDFFAKDRGVKIKFGSCEKKTTFDMFLEKGLRTPLEEEKSSGVISWEEWEAEYQPIKNPNSKEDNIWGCMFETSGDDVRYLQEKGYDNHVFWTMVDNDPNSGYVDVLPGAHAFNRLGYFITQKSWTNENLVVSNNPDN